MDLEVILPVKMDDVLDTFYWADIDALIALPGGLQEPLIYEMMNFLLKTKIILKKEKLSALYNLNYCTVQDYSRAKYTCTLV